MDTPLVKRAYNLGLKAVPNFLSLSEREIKFYEDNLEKLPEAILRGFVLPKSTPKIIVVEPKFALLAELGEIIVPDDFVQATWLSSFRDKNKEKFYYYNDDITDENFSNPTHILKPGDKLWVRAHKQIVSGTTTSEERMKFLATQKSWLVGAQGASLVFEQKRDKLPRGYWYSSFDKKSRLWKDADGSRRVPGVNADSDGDFNFGLGSFERVWDGNDVILSFCDVPLET